MAKSEYVYPIDEIICPLCEKEYNGAWTGEIWMYCDNGCSSVTIDPQGGYVNLLLFDGEYISMAMDIFFVIEECGNTLEEYENAIQKWKNGETRWCLKEKMPTLFKVQKELTNRKQNENFTFNHFEKEHEKNLAFLFLMMERGLLDLICSENKVLERLENIQQFLNNKKGTQYISEKISNIGDIKKEIVLKENPNSQWKTIINGVEVLEEVEKIIYEYRKEILETFEKEEKTIKHAAMIEPSKFIRDIAREVENELDEWVLDLYETEEVFLEKQKDELYDVVILAGGFSTGVMSPEEIFDAIKKINSKQKIVIFGGIKASDVETIKKWIKKGANQIVYKKPIEDTKKKIKKMLKNIK